MQVEPQPDLNQICVECDAPTTLLRNACCAIIITYLLIGPITLNNAEVIATRFHGLVCMGFGAW